jgi:AhpD family alkylhydroperoxidase
MSESHRINVAKRSSSTYLGLVSLTQEVSAIARQAGLDPGLSELLKVRASQLNGCAYCLRIHTRDALKAGETTDRLAVLSAWRDSGYFNAAERAALALTEAITTLPNQRMPAAAVKEAKDHLTHDQYVAVTWIAMTINTWNRISMISGYPVEPD